MKAKVRLMKIRLIGHPEDVERSTSSLKQTGSVVSDSANYPTKTQEVRRYSYRVGKRVKHRHIPGGCATSAIASNRADEVRVAIATGSSVASVLELIRSWKNRKIK